MSRTKRRKANGGGPAAAPARFFEILTLPAGTIELEVIGVEDIEAQRAEVAELEKAKAGEKRATDRSVG